MSAYRCARCNEVLNGITQFYVPVNGKQTQICGKCHYDLLKFAVKTELAQRGKYWRSLQ